VLLAIAHVQKEAAIASRVHPGRVSRALGAFQMNLTTVAVFSLNSCASVMLIAVNKVLLSRLGFVWGMLCSSAARVSCSHAV
jgi:hypothetical protein